MNASCETKFQQQEQVEQFFTGFTWCEILQMSCKNNSIHFNPSCLKINDRFCCWLYLPASAHTFVKFKNNTIELNCTSVMRLVFIFSFLWRGAKSWVWIKLKFTERRVLWKHCFTSASIYTNLIETNFFLPLLVLRMNSDEHKFCFDFIKLISIAIRFAYLAAWVGKVNQMNGEFFRLMMVNPGKEADRE